MIITGGKYKGRKIGVPSQTIARPTLSQVRMGIFNTLYSLLGDFQHKSFLDVFGGSGVMGLEALSRGFDNVVVLEQHPQAVQIIKSNYQKLGLTSCIKKGDSLKLLPGLKNNYDVVFIDPPYSSGIYDKVFEALLNIKTNILVVEHSEKIATEKFEILKEKNYSGKYVSYFRSKEGF